MEQILLKIKKYFEFVIKNGGNEHGTYGLCGVAQEVLGYDEYNLYKNYLHDFIKETNHKRFYDCDGNTTYTKSQFLWKPTNYKVRLKWLDREIKKLSTAKN